MWPSLSLSSVLSVVATGLAAASFWNAYFTRGRIVLPQPLGVTLMQGVGVGQSVSSGWIHVWRLYLFFCNTGARPRVVYNVRLNVTHGEQSTTLPIIQRVKTVMPQHDESSLTAAGGDFAHAFALAPRGTFEQASMFRAPTTAEPWLHQEGVYQCAIEALVDRRWLQPAWKTLTTFTVTLTSQKLEALASGHWTNAETESEHLPTVDGA